MSLLNSINGFGGHLIDLDALGQLLEHYENEDEKLYLHHEFVDLRFAAVLDKPKSIKDQFWFSVYKTFQAVRGPHMPSTCLADEYLGPGKLREWVTSLPNGTTLLEKVELLDTKLFRERTNCARNRAHHRVSLGLGWGLTPVAEHCSASSVPNRPSR